MESRKHSAALKTSRRLTRKGRSTKISILEAARDVFTQQGYYNASVAEIGRRAGLSQGAFYQYFRNKEQALFELNDRIISDFWRKTETLDLDRAGFDERLERVVALLLGHARENHYFHRILGEFELIDLVAIGYYDSMARYIRNYLRREMNAGFIRPLDPTLTAYGLIGAANFHTMDWGSDGKAYPPESLVQWTVELLKHGISGTRPWAEPSGPSGPVSLSPDRGPVEAEERLTQGQATTRAILRAAELVLGQVGFHRAGIADITREAGVAQGTYYVHFKSKQDLMESFVRYLSREMRRTLKLATEGLDDRRDQERVGVRAFFRFLEEHRRIYRVVSESETMGREKAAWYYRKLAEGYQPGLAAGVERAEVRSDLPVPFMVHSLMGFIHMIGLKWLVWNSSPHAEFPEPLQDDLASLLLFGLNPA